jgi:hypothetical protein
MAKLIYLGSQKVSLSPTKSIGKGGEADVYDIGNGQAVKVYKDSQHPDLANNSQERRSAEHRLQEHQNKLPDLLVLSNNLSKNIVTPIELVNNNEDLICGYTMRLLNDAEVLSKYGDKKFRQSLGDLIENKIIDYFKKIHTSVLNIHNNDIVIGDFNDLNILILEDEPYFIDIDSWQFKNYLCQLYTTTFVDPILCDEQQNAPVLIRAHNQNSDWYAYNILLMKTLLFVGPYGGMYMPSDKKEKIQHNRRPLERISVFNEDVKYPKPAISYDVLPDELLDYWQQVFENDKREQFPVKFLNNMRWTNCSNCGKKHAKSICPFCAMGTPTKTIQRTHGNVTAENVFETDNRILFSDSYDDLYWLYWENDTLFRENDIEVNSTQSTQGMRFRLHKNDTFIAKNNLLLKIDKKQNIEKFNIDTYNNIPVFDVNGKHFYWLDGGKLYKDDFLAPKYIGDVCKNQTLFWAGPKFGFGFYRAGNLQQMFIFDAEDQGIKDTIDFPRISGQLLDSTCVFSSSYCWFFITVQENNMRLNKCYILNQDGDILLEEEQSFGHSSWLGNIQGKSTMGDMLFTPTDEGVVRVVFNTSKGMNINIFEDTEPFVNSESYLQVNASGLYVVNDQEIYLLQMS